MSIDPSAHIDSVHLTIPDLGKSIAFYQDRIGLRLQRHDDTTAAFGAGGPELLVLHASPEASRVHGTTGLYHFAILVPSRAALGRSLRRLSDKRWPMSGAADHLVSEALYLDDPDGLGIEIYRDRPRDAWRVANGELAMATDPLDLQSIYEEPGAETPWNGLDAGTIMGHVHLHVPHLDTAESFYCDRIGFDPVVRRYPGALFVSAGGYHHHLGLNTWVGVGAPPPPENAVGLRAFTIESARLQPAQINDESTGVQVVLVHRR